MGIKLIGLVEQKLVKLFSLQNWILPKNFKRC